MASCQQAVLPKSPTDLNVCGFVPFYDVWGSGSSKAWPNRKAARKARSVKAVSQATSQGPAPSMQQQAEDANPDEEYTPSIL